MAVRKEIHGLFFTPNSEKEINKQQTTNGLSHGNNNKKKAGKKYRPGICTSATGPTLSKGLSGVQRLPVG